MDQTEVNRHLMQVIKCLVAKLGNNVSITKQEYAETEGRLEILPSEDSHIESAMIVRVWFK